MNPNRFVASITKAQLHMFSLTYGGFAVSFAFFMFRSCVATVEEYTPLFMGQLGYNAIYIGLVPVLGLVTQTIGIPLAGFLADKFRIRKLLLLISILILIPNTLLFLVPRHPEITCETSSTNSSLANDNGTAFAASIASLESRTNTTIASRKLTNEISLSRSKETTIELSENESSRIYHINSPNETLVKQNNSDYKLTFFLIILFLRGIFELLKRLTVTLITVATMTHIKDDKTKFGFYACWGEIGAGLSLFLVGILVGHVRHFLCGEQVPSYHVSFFYAVAVQCMTLFALPWMKYEYLEKRVVNYADVKKALCKPHYILMLVVCAHAGLCSAFQTRWEFWYMEKLGGSPLVMAVGGLIRRPIVGVWFLLSRGIINRLGELNVIAISLFIFAASFSALAFIANPWLVIVFDNFQSAAHVLMFASFVIHFSKAGSKASSAVIQGKVRLTIYSGRSVFPSLCNIK